jgi:hypothetical protein
MNKESFSTEWNMYYLFFSVPQTKVMFLIINVFLLTRYTAPNFGKSDAFDKLSSILCSCILNIWIVLRENFIYDFKRWWWILILYFYCVWLSFFWKLWGIIHFNVKTDEGDSEDDDDDDDVDLTLFSYLGSNFLYLLTCCCFVLFFRFPLV